MPRLSPLLEKARDSLERIRKRRAPLEEESQAVAVLTAAENEVFGPSQEIEKTSRLNASELADEARIVWVEDIGRLDYVRENLEEFAGRRKGKLKPPAGRLIGYAELRDDKKSTRYGGYFLRRVFWLKEHDRDSMPNGCYRAGTPCEGVDPRTVGAGVPGTLTNRAWYGMGHEAIVSGKLEPDKGWQQWTR